MTDSLDRKQQKMMVTFVSAFLLPAAIVSVAIFSMSASHLLCDYRRLVNRLTPESEQMEAAYLKG